MTDYTKQFSLAGKVAMVTGSAQGIGAEIATALGSMGASVVLSDRDIDAGNKQVEAFTSKGIKAIFVKLDVTSESDWSAAIEKVEAEFGGLDCLVNNAGILFSESSETQSLEKFNKLQEVNVGGVYLGCKYASSLMQKSATSAQRASIVNMSSLAGLFGSATMSAYCSSKGAVRVMTKALAAEYGPNHIRVNSVHPGLIQTDMGDAVQDMLQQRMGSSAEDALNFSLAITPLQQLGSTQDVAAAVIFLASNASNFITASETVVDGGISGCQ